MAYAALDVTKPDAVSQNVTQAFQSIRDNLRANRDMVILGEAFGWPMTPSGGSADQPAVITYALGTERLRATLTYGTTGGADGNVTQAVYAYSSNSGASYDTIKTETISYDASGNVTGTSWS